jgi:L-rhamnose isomerase
MPMDALRSTIDAGDVARCEACRRVSVVRSIELGRDVQVIVCHDGIRAVGVEHRPVRQRLIVSLRQLRTDLETLGDGRSG